MKSVQQYLTATQRHKLSHHKDVYLVLRSIYLLKTCFASQRITKQMYQTQITKLISRYNLLIDLIPNYNPKIFSQELSIPQAEILPALKEIQSRQINKVKNLLLFFQSSQSNTSYLFIEITSILIETLDFNETNVGQARLLFQRLINRLNVLCDLLKNQQFQEKVIKLKIKIKDHIGDKTTSQQISQIQLDQIKIVIRGIYDLLICLTKK